MKWEPVAAMVALLLLGVWLVWGQGLHPGLAETRAGATLHEIRLGSSRGILEVAPGGADAAGSTYRFLYRDGSASAVLTRPEIEAALGTTPVAALDGADGSAVFRLLNITSWGGLTWVALGLGGQIAFFGRMLIQWIVSEKKRESVVPEAFWWLSLFGGVALFTYFAWRRDIVGVMGQSTGVVIYARNLRLIHKRRKRALREAAADEGSGGGEGAA
ncbi:MAG: lipid-A-disaccharide synthase N-terminal domain-containing protein [Planctomycetota bacterium]